MAIFPGGCGLFSQHQNVSILDFIGDKDDGGGGNKCSYQMCKVPVKSLTPTNQHSAFLQARCPSFLPSLYRYISVRNPSDNNSSSLGSKLISSNAPT